MVARFVEQGTVALMLLALTGCGKSSSETPGAGGTGVAPGTGGTGGAAGSGGTPGTGGAPATGGAMGTGGAGGSGGSGGSAGTGGAGTGAPTPDGGVTAACAGDGAFTVGQHIVMDVTWPASNASTPGTGKIHLWNRSKLTATGGDLGGSTQGCGTLLPPTMLNSLGSLAAGGSKILIEVPDPVWDAPSMPKYATRGTQTGAAIGSSVTLSWTALIGVNLSDPLAAWPDSSRGLVGVDADGDGALGYTAAPRTGDGYVLPPTGIGLGGSAPAAEKVYLVSRHIVEVTSMRASCEQLTGTANVKAFDSHVLGCQVRGGAECTPAQTDFLDQNRMKYQVKSATFEARKMPDDATCADVRKAFPAP